MRGDIFLNQKEARRVYVMEQVVQGQLTVSQAASLLSLSERQIKRLKKGVKEEGISFLAHKNRQRKPKHAIPEETRQKVVTLAQSDYKGASCSHMAELLDTYQQISISPRSIRRILNMAGILNGHSRKAPRRRRRRERMPKEGILAQIDASPFAWLEDRGPKMSLHGAVDDATGKILGLHFEYQECLNGYLNVLMQMAQNDTLTQRVYSDLHAIFFSPKKDKLSIEEELAGKKVALTQFGRVLEELGMVHIPSYSPQAKGRVERFWGTLQHRLVIEMRIAGISTLEEANAFLPAFIDNFNRRFAVEPADPEPAYLSSPKNVECIICLKEKRQASNGSTISYHGKTYRLRKKDSSIALLRPRSQVLVLTHLDGSLSALYEGNRLSLEVFAAAPPRAQNVKEKPKHNASKPTSCHPWRKKFLPPPMATEADIYCRERYLKKNSKF